HAEDHELEALFLPGRAESDLEGPAVAAEPTLDLALTAAHDAAAPIHPEEREPGPGHVTVRRLGQPHGPHRRRIVHERPADLEPYLVGAVGEVGRHADRPTRSPRRRPEKQNAERQGEPARRPLGEESPCGHCVTPYSVERAGLTGGSGIEFGAGITTGVGYSR